MRWSLLASCLPTDQKSRLLSSFFLSAGIGGLAYKRKLLSRSGVVGAISTGTTSVWLGGWTWGLSLIFFFASSSIFSHWRATEKAVIANDKFSKGAQRDLKQVLANGGMATGLALGYGMSESPTVCQLLQIGYVGALATATADTWATELGVLSPHTPRLITSGKKAAPGTSGGVTPLGMLASMLGAFSLGTVFWLLQGGRRTLFPLPLIALVSGLCGSLCDSFLGATIQRMYFCPTCNKETERQIHLCQTRAHPIRGKPFIDNDVVNFLATLVGSLVAMLLYILLRPRNKEVAGK